jgi:hypothetical protein
MGTPPAAHAASEGAYGGSPAAVPGTVQAANYDTGGQGVAYNVASVNGTANSYRSDGVDLETCTDTGCGYDLGWTATGQWFNYTVNVASTGTYTVSLRLASPNGVTNALHIANSAGTNLSGAVNAPMTGGWQNWTTVTTSVTLPAGQQTLTVYQDNGGWNIHYLSFAASIDTPAWYEVVNQNSGLCTSAAGGGTTNGTAVQQLPCTGATSQLWQFVRVAPGYYEVLNDNAQAAGESWNITGGVQATANGALLQLWSYGGTANTNELFAAKDLGNGYYNFVANNSGLCIDTPGASTTSGVQLQQYTCNGTGAQAFRLVQQTPGSAYMGWSSWSLESTNYPGVNPTGGASWLTEQHVLQQADALAAKLKSHGYNYVNIDSGWSNGFDAYGRPVANPTTFPDGITYVGNYAHNLGLKLGIYLVVGLDPGAYNGGNTPIYGAAGCYTSNIVYPDLRKTNGWNSAYQINFSNSCAQAYINSIANQLASWGVDFLKLDGVGPGSFQGGPNHDNTPDIAAWSTALKQTSRPIQFVISWALSHNQASTWVQYTNGWRVDTDVECYCNTLVTWNNSVKQRWNDVVQWIPNAGPGHWNNLDSLDVGNSAMDGLTDIERQSYMTLWAIEGAPLYSGDDLTQLDSYGLSLLTNDEVIAVDQAGNPAKPVSQRTDQQVWYARNVDGSYTVALFNLGSGTATVTANWSDLGIVGSAGVRDLWSHTNLGNSTGSFAATLSAHGSRLLRIIPNGSGNGIGGPSMPTNLRGTGSTSSSVSLAWDPSSDNSATVTGYDIYAGTQKVASVSGTTATVTGLAPATGYQFTVVARDAGGQTSAASGQIAVTTPAVGGPVSYEAESSANTIGGGASVFSCSGCSGGAKVGYLGGNGYLIFNNVNAPVAGTYLMTLAYVDGDSSRTAVVTVNGMPFELPLSGTNDNNWGIPQTVTVPVQLNPGSNTIKFSNPAAYVSDIDKIAV